MGAVIFIHNGAGAVEFTTACRVFAGERDALSRVESMHNVGITSELGIACNIKK